MELEELVVLNNDKTIIDKPLLTTDIEQDKNIYKSYNNILWHVIVISLGSTMNGYCWCIFNNLFKTIAPHFEWNSDPKTREWIEGAINGSYILAATVGTFLTVAVMSYGRKFSFIFCDVI